MITTVVRTTMKKKRYTNNGQYSRQMSRERQNRKSHYAKESESDTCYKYSERGLYADNCKIQKKKKTSKGPN